MHATYVTMMTKKRDRHYCDKIPIYKLFFLKVESEEALIALVVLGFSFGQNFRLECQPLFPFHALIQTQLTFCARNGLYDFETHVICAFIYGNVLLLLQAAHTIHGSARLPDI